MQKIFNMCFICLRIECVWCVCIRVYMYVCVMRVRVCGVWGVRVGVSCVVFL